MIATSLHCVLHRFKPAAVSAVIRAFTLVELLVVVAIIALLLAILLPSLSKAKAAAQSTRCQAKLHQIGLAYRMYAGEYNDAIAPFMNEWCDSWGAHVEPTWGDFVPRWFHFLNAYVNNYTLFNCDVMDQSQTVGSSTGFQTQVVNSDGGSGHASWVHKGRSEKGATSNYACAPYVSFLAKPVSWDKRLRVYTYSQLDAVAAQAGTAGNQLMHVMDGVYQVTKTQPGSNDTWYSTAYGWQFVHPGRTANVLVSDGHIAIVRNDGLQDHWISNSKDNGNFIAVNP